MNKKWLAVSGILAIVAVVGLSGCSEGAAASGDTATVNINNQQSGIWVSGQGEVTVTPDIATLRIGIQAQDASVADARDQAAAAMTAVMDALTANGIAEKDIQTDYFSISQRSRWDSDKQEEIVTGYQVSNTVSVKIRDIEKMSDVIDAAANAGGDNTIINSINFSVDDPDPYYEQARQLAMENAKAKAEQLAELAGTTLGSVTYISESSASDGGIYRTASVAYDSMSGGYSTPISAGELDISINVQVAYEIN